MRHWAHMLLSNFYGGYLYRHNPYWLQLLFSPVKTTASSIYTAHERRVLARRRPPSKNALTVVCISDTHTATPALPPGDILIHAGDITNKGYTEDVQVGLDWLNEQPHAHKIFVAGNHEYCLDEDLAANRGNPEKLRWGEVRYLKDSSTVIDFPNGRKVKIFGSPHTIRRSPYRTFLPINAFQYGTGEPTYLNRVPDDTDILITHSPPRSHHDSRGAGDPYLTKELWRVRPSLHVFGHTHSGFGTGFMRFDETQRLYDGLMSAELRAYRLANLGLRAANANVEDTSEDKRCTLLVNAAWRGAVMRNEPIITVQI